MAECCPHCHRPMPKPRKAPELVSVLDTSQMSDAEVFKHYKRTERIETLKFWIANTRSYPEVNAAFTAMFATVSSLPIKPADFDRQMRQLQAEWRRQSNVRERKDWKRRAVLTRYSTAWNFAA